jgi:hypothetical protein
MHHVFTIVVVVLCLVCTNAFTSSSSISRVRPTLLTLHASLKPQLTKLVAESVLII